MDKDRIEDNPSYTEFKKELEGFETLQKLIEFFPSSKQQNNELNESFLNIKNQLELHSKSPDKFNDYYAQRGWIAHESINFELMLTSIELAGKGLIDIGEQGLVDYYTSEKMKHLLYQLKNVGAFSDRYDFFMLAYEDTIAEKYYAVVPVLLMMIDGAVNDIDKGKGFFADKTNLTAWDSIAAHSTGLTALKEIFNAGRNKTSKEEITLPYRNGILHGRDLGYANKTVTAKCWAALFAIKDWAYAIKQGKKFAPPPKPELSLTELENVFKGYTESQNRNELVSKKIKNWKPRQLAIGFDVPEKGLSTEYKDYTPEQEAIRFVEYWTKGNYGAISKQIHHFSDIPISENKEAGRLREIFKDKKLIDYKIIKISDCAPIITEITLSITVEYNNEKYSKEITLRFLYEGVEGNILISGDTGGKWKFIQAFLSHIEFIHL
jgi:hypothetical protein